MSAVDLNAYATGVLFRKSFLMPVNSSVFPTSSFIRLRVSGLLLISLILIEMSFVQSERGIRQGIVLINCG